MSYSEGYYFNRNNRNLYKYVMIVIIMTTKANSIRLPKADWEKLESLKKAFGVNNLSDTIHVLLEHTEPKNGGE